MVAKPIVVRFPNRSPQAPVDPPSRGRILLETHYPLIQKKLHHLSRRSGLPEYEAEEFRSWTLIKLVEDDYRILANWEKRSTLPTFLTVMLTNIMRDYRTHVWGKWRPTAAAKRLGNEAVLLEQLCGQDGLSIDDAVEATSLPRQMERRGVGEEEFLRIPVDGRVESQVEEAERSRTEDQLRVLLPPLLQALSAEDRLLLKLHYGEGFSTSLLPTHRASGTVSGKGGREADWIRLFRPDGSLVLTEGEAERQRAEKAEAELARLRALAERHDAR